jgi:formamidopyrimidine-DNA glycosylase
MLNKNIQDFDKLVDKKIECVVSRGNVIHVKLNNETNLVLDPEYGGKIFYYKDRNSVLNKYHLRIDFSDSSVFTVRLSSMGVIQVYNDAELENSYVYRRDFNPEVASPIDEDFTFEVFAQILMENNRMLKSVLVGKDAIVVGLSNSAFQDILYRAKIHPKRKASDLKKEEKLALYNSIELVIKERIRWKGKNRFFDLYGNQGCYIPAMGPNMKHQTCTNCGAQIEKISLGGGQVYLCPKCQL